ncbi:MAG: hypothetical protein BWY97_00065 [Tenericutes bacterium ADurb.BinA124]|nr:MAG: hypothetical protein BWY97_00065 [Tenericutes bacterium ADurb.BinA124]
MEVKNYRKKPLVIEAVQLTEGNFGEVNHWITGKKASYTTNRAIRYAYGGLPIDTLEGRVIAKIGDYVIKGIKGEFYPCKTEIFEESYEENGN